MKTPELKPCPFCGGEAEMRNDGLILDGLSTFYTTWRIKCITCGASVKAQRGTFSFEKDGKLIETNDAKYMIATAWNRRATDENA